jgi:hypothetical protein
MVFLSGAEWRADDVSDRRSARECYPARGIPLGIRAARTAPCRAELLPATCGALHNPASPERA